MSKVCFGWINEYLLGRQFWSKKNLFHVCGGGGVSHCGLICQPVIWLGKVCFEWGKLGWMGKWVGSRY